MLLIVAIIMVVVSGGTLFSLSNTSRGLKNSGIATWLSNIAKDLIENPVPMTFMILANKLEYAPALKPFLTMGKRSRTAFRLLLLSLMFFVISASWNFAMVQFELDNSPFAVTLGVFHGIWIGFIFLIILDIIWRIFMLTISGIYSGLSEDGYAGVTGKFLSIAIILATVLLIVLVPEKHSYIIERGIDPVYIYMATLGASIMSWIILLKLLIRTMHNPKSLLTKGASVKQSKDVSSQIMKGGLLMISFLVIAMWTSVYSLEKINPLSWIFNPDNLKVHTLYYIIETMSTVGYGGNSPLTTPAMFMAGGIMFTSVITIGLFIGRVFDKHELDEDEEILMSKTSHLFVDEMSLNELRQFCKKEGISIPAKADKEKIIEILERLFE